MVTHTHTNGQTTIPSAHAGEGNKVNGKEEEIGYYFIIMLEYKNLYQHNTMRNSVQCPTFTFYIQLHINVAYGGPPL